MDGSKVQKKDRLLAITFNGTDACKVPELLFQPIYIEEHISGIQKSEFQEGEKWEPDGWLFLKFYGIFLCRLISQNVIFLSLALLKKKTILLIFMGEGLNYLKFIHLW